MSSGRHCCTTDKRFFTSCGNRVRAAGTISLKAIFQNPQNKLWPGQYVNAHLQLRIQHDAVTLPVAAVQHGPDGLYVYLAKPDNTVRNQPITVSYQNEQVAVVSKGLNGGDGRQLVDRDEGAGG